MNITRKDILWQRWMYVTSDMAGAILSYLLIIYISLCRFNEDGGMPPSVEESLTDVIIYLLCVELIYWVSGIYNRPFGKSRLQLLIVSVSSALVITFLISTLRSEAFPSEYGEWKAAILIFLILLLPCFLFRLFLTEVLKGSIAKWSKVRSVAIGNAKDVENGKAWLSDSRNVREKYEVVGEIILQPKNIPDVFYGSIKDIIDFHEADCLIVFLGDETKTYLMEILRECFCAGIPVRIAPDSISFVTRSIRLRDIYGEPFVDLTSPAMSDFSNNLKRASDVVISVLALVLLSPMFLILYALIRGEDRGGVIYRQIRLGYHLKPFVIYKFRSMVMDAEQGRPQLSREGDPRVTRIGRVMRRYRLDELPQFWNVLKGDMSLVGPRPERPYFAKKLMRLAPGYFLTSQVKPGLTSWGMVRYGYARSVREMKERLRFDLIYLTNMSLFIDLKIIIYTVRIVLTGKGI